MAPPIGAGPFLSETVMPFDVEILWNPLKPDIKRYTKALQAGMTRLWRDALKQFITVVMQNIHIDTGMSAASMRKVALDARVWTKLQGEIVSRRQRVQRLGVTHIDGGYDKSAYRSIQEGIKVADAATSIKFDLPVMEFNFSIEVFQWWFHEIKKQPPLWTSLEPAGQAFIDFIDQNVFNYIPGIEELLS